jgi:hypothetical protein
MFRILNQNRDESVFDEGDRCFYSLSSGRFSVHNVSCVLLLAKQINDSWVSRSLYRLSIIRWDGDLVQTLRLERPRIHKRIHRQFGLIVQKVCFPEILKSPPLQIMRPVRFPDGPPLYLDKQLCRLLHFQAFRPFQSLRIAHLYIRHGCHPD